MRLVKFRGGKRKKCDLSCGTWGQATTRQFHIVLHSRYNPCLLAGSALKMCIGVSCSKMRLEEIQSAVSKEGEGGSGWGWGGGLVS